ncbi:hypothetical protein [Clostridium sp. HBUAS56017]|uniref:hypothetical protein n=1 Tax=Clostridium sp. HBUAS56017 TaxID=2571128 RepID=UPI0011776EF0|nr:hypothetical protein [Clostridium sp. HBUAS56017]
MDKVIFLFLSLVSGCVEIGGVVYGISIDLPVLQVAALGLAYQIGNLVPNPFKLNKKVTAITAFLSMGCFVIYEFVISNYWVLVLGYIFIAMTIQSVRSLQKDKVSTTVKRTFRILGFVIAPFIGVEQNIIISIILIFIVVYSKYKIKESKFIKPSFKFINGIMVIHQMHYFAYVYFILIIISKLTSSFGIKVIGILVMAGWITYTSVSHIIKGKNYRQYFIAGHFILSIILICLAKNYDNMFAIIFWIATGFGGGTVYCIGEVNKINQDCSKGDIVFSENIGHIFGVIAGMLVYWIFNDLRAPIYLSACCAITAFILMFIYGLLKKDVAKKELA